MARKLNKNLVALGSAAIVAVYAAGFARTSSAALDAATSPSPVVAAVSTSQPVAGNTATAVAQAVSAAMPAAAYRDGTFTGAGSNRFGEVDVAVTVQSGAITAVNITRSTTRYPVARIARLPGEVVSRQSAQIDFVSGATYSSLAFKDAVTRALAQAAAGTTASTAGQQG